MKWKEISTLFSLFILGAVEDTATWGTSMEQKRVLAWATETHRKFCIQLFSCINGVEWCIGIYDLVWYVIALYNTELFIKKLISWIMKLRFILHDENGKRIW